MVLENLVGSLLDFSGLSYPEFLVDLILAVLILLVGFVIARMAGRVTERLLREIELNRLLASATRMQVSAEQFLASAIRYIAYFFVIIMALNQLGLTTTLLYIISSAIVIVIIVSFILGLRDMIPNMVAGLSIQKKGFLKKGDHVNFREIEGTVSHLDLLETRIETPEGDIISVPNQHLIKYNLRKKKKSS